MTSHPSPQGQRAEAIHYGGDLRVVRGKRVTLILAGWAACCSGDKARRIRERNQHTINREAVTCKRCLALMKKASP